MEDEEVEWELSPENAHSRAIELFTEEFFWDICDDLSPFGNDDGWDTLMNFRDWRLENDNEDINRFLDEFLEGWDVKNENWKLDTVDEIKNELQKDEFSFLTRDNVIIALVFAQIVIEGKVDSNVKEKALWAIERQQNEFLLSEKVPNEFHEEWKLKLKKMNEILINIE